MSTLPEQIKAVRAVPVANLTPADKPGGSSEPNRLSDPIHRHARPARLARAPGTWAPVEAHRQDCWWIGPVLIIAGVLGLALIPFLS